MGSPKVAAIIVRVHRGVLSSGALSIMQYPSAALAWHGKCCVSANAMGNITGLTLTASSKGCRVFAVIARLPLARPCSAGKLATLL